MKYYVIDKDTVVGKTSRPSDAVSIWPSNIPLQAAKYLDDSLDPDAAHALYLGAAVEASVIDEKAVRILTEFDKCDYLVGMEAVKCFNTTNVDAMNADKDTIQEILKGNGYLVDVGFKARRDLADYNIVKGRVLYSQEDLETYAGAMMILIRAYGQKRVQLMADRDNAVEAIEAEYV